MKLFLIILVAAVLLAFGFQLTQAGGQSGGNQATKTAASKVYGDTGKASQGWALIEDGALLIDVRSVSEFESGHIEGSLNILHSDIEGLSAAIGEDKSRSVVLYCRSGRRVGRAMDALEAMGYTGLFNATGYTALEATRP